MTRIHQLEKIINADLITVENGARPQLDDDGQIVVDTATCGTCGMSWNDALITERTPVPSARCPYEYIHPEIKELARLRKRRPKRETLTQHDARINREYRKALKRVQTILRDS